MSRRIIRGWLLFISLMVVSLSYIAAGAILLGFLIWLALTAYNFYFSSLLFFLQINSWPLVMGAIGTIYIFIASNDAQYVIGKSLKGTINFINWLLPTHKKEAQDG